MKQRFYIRKVINKYKNVFWAVLDRQNKKYICLFSFKEIAETAAKLFNSKPDKDFGFCLNVRKNFKIIK